MPIVPTGPVTLYIGESRTPLRVSYMELDAEWAPEPLPAVMPGHLARGTVTISAAVTDVEFSPAFWDMLRRIRRGQRWRSAAQWPPAFRGRHA